MPGAAHAEAEKGWIHMINRHGQAGLEAELVAAQTAFGEDDSEENWARLVEAKARLEAAGGNEAEL